MLMLILPFLFSSAFATDYCKLCENGTHTMCLYKEGPADNCINYTKISLKSGEKQYILDIHNDLRNHVASGQESRGGLGSQPPAADMYLMEWDNELTTIAQRWVDQCISVNATRQHDKCKKTERFEVGQNIITAITTEKELPDLSVLILNWYKQIIHVIPSDVDDFIGTWRGNYMIGQYTQLVWAKTRYVGCGLASFKGSVGDSQYYIRLVCNYGPKGNVIGQSVYQRGEPCSKCPQKQCDGIRSNLCVGTKTGQKDVFKKSKKKLTTQADISEYLRLDTSVTETTNLSIFYNFNNTSDTDMKNVSLIVIQSKNRTSTPFRNSNILFNGSREDYLKNLTSNNVGLFPSISIMLKDFFNQSIIRTLDITTDSIGEDKSIIDLTKHKCEKKIHLDNGVTILQECGDGSTHSVYAKKFPQNSLRKPDSVTDGKNVLFNNRNYRTAKGTWHNGHCKCAHSVKLKNSKSNTLNRAYFLFVTLPFVHFLVI